MPKEILGGNSRRRARLHRVAAGREPAFVPPSREKLDQMKFSEVRDLAIEVDVFKVGLGRDELVEAILSAGS